MDFFFLLNTAMTSERKRTSHGQKQRTKANIHRTQMIKTDIEDDEEKKIESMLHIVK